MDKKLSFVNAKAQTKDVWSTVFIFNKQVVKRFESDTKNGKKEFVVIKFVTPTKQKRILENEQVEIKEVKETMFLVVPTSVMYGYKVATDPNRTFERIAENEFSRFFKVSIPVKNEYHVRILKENNVLAKETIVFSKLKKVMFNATQIASEFAKAKQKDEFSAKEPSEFEKENKNSIVDSIIHDDEIEM